jgi:hypothetical protein
MSDYVKSLEEQLEHMQAKMAVQEAQLLEQAQYVPRWVTTGPAEHLYITDTVLFARIKGFVECGIQKWHIAFFDAARESTNAKNNNRACSMKGTEKQAKELAEQVIWKESRYDKLDEARRRRYDL